MAAIPKDQLVEAHGTFDEATCTNLTCGKKYISSETNLVKSIANYTSHYPFHPKVKSAVIANNIPRCDSCSSLSSASEGSVVKPDIVFFGEDLPQRFKTLMESDFMECDLLIVMGTSLQVHPFCSLVQRVKETIPRLLVRTRKYLANKCIKLVLICWMMLGTILFLDQQGACGDLHFGV